MRNQMEALCSEVRDGFRHVNHRLHRLETAVADICRDEAGTTEDMAYQQAGLDHSANACCAPSAVWTWRVESSSRIV